MMIRDHQEYEAIVTSILELFDAHDLTAVEVLGVLRMAEHCVMSDDDE